ncbi:MAG: hypothetical protein ACPG4T_14990 [Nannocystaceae bacterium]
MTTPQSPPAAPIAGWIGVGLSLGALACVLWFIVQQDFWTLLEIKVNDAPLLSVGMGLGIGGVVSGILALARQEPRQLAALALVVGLSAVLAKFVLGAVLGALIVGLIIAMLVQ